MGQTLVPELKQSKILTINIEKFSYEPNSNIKGNIILNLITNLNICDIEIECYCIEGWYYNGANKLLKEKIPDANDYQIKNTSIGKIKLNLPRLLNINSPILILGRGQHSFNFSFPLNVKNPSFELRGNYGRVFLRYILSAKVILPNNNNNMLNNKKKNENIESEVIFQVISLQKVDDKDTSYDTENNIYKWGLMNKGISKMKITIPKTNYSFQSNIPLVIDIDNKQCSLSAGRVKVSTKRKMTYYYDKKASIIEEIPVTTSTYGFYLEKKKRNIFRYFYNLKDIYLKYNTVSGISEPYNNKDIDWNNFLPTIKTNLFSCEYYIKITLYFNSFVQHNSRPRLTFPIILTHKCSNNFDFPEVDFRDLDNNLLAQSQIFPIYNNHNNKNNYNNNKNNNKNNNNNNNNNKNNNNNNNNKINNNNNNNNNLNLKDEDDIGNMVTDDGSGQLFIYYDKLKKKKWAQESQKRAEIMKKEEEIKRKKEEDEIKKKFDEPFPYVIVSKELKEQILNYLKLNNDEYNLFDENEEDKNMYIPQSNNNDNDFFIFKN